jgi:hypothetical protein
VLLLVEVHRVRPLAGLNFIYDADVNSAEERWPRNESELDALDAGCRMPMQADHRDAATSSIRCTTPGFAVRLVAGAHHSRLNK